MDKSEWEKIKEDIKKLAAQAVKEKKWLYSINGYWFSPEEIIKENKNGRYVWGVEYWRLGNPRDALRKLKEVARDARKRALDFKKRIDQWKELQNEQK